MTAEDVLNGANISYTDFGSDIVDPDGDDEAQRTAAIAHIAANILPAAEGEVSVPFLRASRGYSLPFSSALILRRYTALSGDQTAIDSVNSQLRGLYDGAVMAYARSEINKQVASNSRLYDKDADQDREFADAKLKKLVEAVMEIVGASGGVDGSVSAGSMVRPASTSVQANVVF